MTINFDQPVANLVGMDIDHVDLVDNNDPRFRAYIADPAHIDITFVEPLQFHSENAAANPRRASRWTQHVDASGYLTQAASDRLIAELRGLTGIRDIDRQTGDEPADEPTWAIRMRTDVLAGESLSQWFQRAAWPAISTVINITDPGTWNSPYLFSVLDD